MSIAVQHASLYINLSCEEKWSCDSCAETQGQHPKIPEITADAMSCAKKQAMASESYDLSTPMHTPSIYICIYVVKCSGPVIHVLNNRFRTPKIPEITAEVMSRPKDPQPWLQRVMNAVIL